MENLSFLTREDIELLEKKKISQEELSRQLDCFRSGFPFMKLQKPATVGDGILRFTESETENLAAQFDERNRSVLRQMKFVPASGAATRMFKNLFSFLEKPDSSETGFYSPMHTLNNLHGFAFFEDLKKAVAMTGNDIDKCVEEKKFSIILECLLNKEHMNYTSLPKGLLKFHRYGTYSRTAAEEHLTEGAQYARDCHGKAKIHFTVSPEHMEGFRRLCEKVQPVYEEKLGVQYDITFSVQKESTDTLGVEMDNSPFREKNGMLHFRPAGHGALLDNLQDIHEEVIFLKNIDNVVPDHLRQTTVLYKKALAGKLLSLTSEIRKHLMNLEKGNANTEEAVRFCHSLGIAASGDASSLHEALNRPVRVCGMVKNEGEPGGGPFWVKGSDGKISLQIVESSQVNMKDEEQKDLFSKATHFNPVDVVCTTLDYKGNPFDLKKFRDQNTGFISVKSKDGRDLKAMELPGLWNGAMAHWITVFVEVPLSTFTPVKMVNDLLKKEHQGV